MSVTNMQFLELLVLGDIMLAIPTKIKVPEMVQNFSVPYLSVADGTLLGVLPYRFVVINK